MKFNEEFETNFPKCILVVKKHISRADPRVNGALFYVSAKFKNSSCIQFTFKTNEKIEIPYRDIFLNVETPSDTITHTLHEVHRRHVTDKKRKTIAKELESKYPCKMEVKMLKSTEIDSLDYGNHNNAMSKIILQKISSENNGKNDLLTYFQEYMAKLIDNSEDSWKGDKINGYIQRYSLKPFYEILFTERVIKYLIKLTEAKILIFL